MDIKDPTCLDLATDSELLNEIGRRHLCTLFVFSSPVRNTKEYTGWSMDYRGDIHAAAGLARRANIAFGRILRKGTG